MAVTARIRCAGHLLDRVCRELEIKQTLRNRCDMKETSPCVGSFSRREQEFACRILRRARAKPVCAQFGSGTAIVETNYRRASARVKAHEACSVGSSTTKVDVINAHGDVCEPPHRGRVRRARDRRYRKPRAATDHAPAYVTRWRVCATALRAARAYSHR